MLNTEYIIFRCNSIGDEGCKYLSLSMQKTTQLTSLDLDFKYLLYRDNFSYLFKTINRLKFYHFFGSNKSNSYVLLNITHLLEYLMKKYIFISRKNNIGVEGLKYLS